MVSYRKSSKDLLSVVILNAIRSLPEQDRDIFVLKHYDGLSDLEISDVLGLTLPKVQCSLRNSSTQLLCHLRPFTNASLPSRVPRKIKRQSEA